MSLKEDIEGVKHEIDNEEKFLTAFVKVERFVKKYKIVFIVGISLAVVAAVLYRGYGYYEEGRINAANEEYLKLLKNPNDKEALATLQAKSTPLYEAYMLQASIKNGDSKTLDTLVLSKNRVIADIATYESALASKNIEKLAAYSANKEAFYRDLALFVLANKYIEKNEFQKARETLNKIPATSELKEYAAYLYHSIITMR